MAEPTTFAGAGVVDAEPFTAPLAEPHGLDDVAPDLFRRVAVADAKGHSPEPRV